VKHQKEETTKGELSLLSKVGRQVSVTGAVRLLITRTAH
jgi:hypothetical protein